MIQRFFGTSVNVDFQRSLNGLQAILQLGQLAMHLRRTSARSAKEKESFIDTLERYSFACAHADASDLDLALLDAALGLEPRLLGLALGDDAVDGLRHRVREAGSPFNVAMFPRVGEDAVRFERRRAGH